MQIEIETFAYQTPRFSFLRVGIAKRDEVTEREHDLM